MTPDPFARFAEVLAEPTLLVDGNGVVLVANKAAVALLGRAAVELLGRPLAGLTADDPARVADLLRLGSRTPQRLLGALKLRGADGTETRVRCEVAALRPRSSDRPALMSVRLFDRHEVVDRFLLLSQRIEELSKEIARRREAEAKLESYSRQLVEDARRKDEFLAMLAHELRNPLAPMSLGVDLLRSIACADPKLERVATMMRRQLGHFARLVDDLLDIARLTHGKIELHRQPVSIAEIVQQAVEMFRPAIAGRGTRLRIDESPAAPRVDADSVRLVQVFGNLLSNALRFGRDGGEIAIITRVDGDDVVVSIGDDGVGIAADLLPHIFDLFVQADRSLDRHHGGLGVGLAIVRSIVELHGGRVSASSAGLGHGTRIDVRLPLYREAAAPADAPVAAAEAVPTDAAALRVLVVEDNHDAAEAMRELLLEWGHEPLAVGDGPAALARFDDWRPDVGLFDIGLPGGMSGLDLARRCRQLAGDRPLLLLALSGYGSPADIRASRDAGFDEHLVKPVDLGRLERRLARHAAGPPVQHQH